MIKSYFSDEAMVWLAYPVYALAFYCLFLAVFFHFFNKNKTLFLVYSSFYCLYTLIPLLDYFFSFVPYFPDTEYYTAFILSKESEGRSLGYTAASYVYSFLGFFALRQPFVFLNFQIFFYFLSYCFFFKAWENYKKSYDLKTHIIFTFLYFSYPSMLIYIPTTLRESIFILSFSILLHSHFVENKYTKITLRTVSFFFLFFIRVPLALMALLFLLGNYVMKRVNIYGKAFIVLVGVTLVFATLDYFNLNPSFFSGMRMWAVKNHADSGLTYGEVDWVTYYDIFASMPKLVLQYLLSPLPIAAKFNPLAYKTLVIDLAFILLLIYCSIASKAFRKYTFWTLFILTLLVLPAGYEHFISGAARHRVPAILMLILLASAGLRDLKLFGKYKLKI